METFLFFLYGYRQKRFLAVVALANLLTNVTLNLSAFLTALLCARQGWPMLAVYAVFGAGEIGAVAAEYFIYKSYFARIVPDHRPASAGNVVENLGDNPDQSTVTNLNRMLFVQTLLTNTVSFLTGLFITFIWGLK
ncbi:MAG: hypothetical protein WCG21_11245 [Eubacteriales bacterium]